jgi:Ni/Fe-hydrogenase subunit HybB-like protein
MNIAKYKFGPGSLVLVALAGLGIVLAVMRFAGGLGAVTNLNDGNAWGFWIGFDILAGIALAAGGFVMAGVIYLFGLERFHPLARPAILTAFIGYLLFLVGLSIDVGKPWNLPQMMISWQHRSALFEVGWCVLLYTTVLLLEFLPVFFERYNMERATKIWYQVTGPLVIVFLTVFTAAMTYSVTWTAVVSVIFTALEVLLRMNVIRRDPRVPVLLIMAGVIFSTLHQSSLGSLFLIMPHRLNALWYTPILPILFFLSAVMAGPAMVMVEAVISAKIFKRKPELDLLSRVAKWMPYLLGVYLAVRLIDLAAAGKLGLAFSGDTFSVLFLAETGLGVVLPLVLFLSGKMRSSSAGLFIASLLVAAGVLFHRLNVAFITQSSVTWYHYVPRWTEVAISVGIVSAGILAIGIISRWLPVYGEEKESA